MATVNGYVGWATNVNRVILDSTTITVGENAIKTDELDSGLKRTKLRGSYTPDKYSVVMEFDWLNKIPGTDRTEYQLFLEWYKYVHKFGTIPFEFPSILYSPESGIKTIDAENNNSTVEYYKITAALEGSKSGTKVQVKMTWETVYGGVVSIPDSVDTVMSVNAKNGYVDINYSSIGSISPTSAEFTLYIDGAETEKTGFYYDGHKVARIYFAPLSDSKLHTVTFSSASSHLNVDAGQYNDTFVAEA